MLQAMNTGHDGSLSTVHANTPRDAIARLETLVLMAGMDLPLRAIREQIASAVDVVVQLTRLRDGTRRVTHVTEVQGMEGETVTLQDAFLFDYSAGVDADGRFLGKPVPTGVRPRFTDQFDDLGITLSPAGLRRGRAGRRTGLVTDAAAARRRRGRGRRRAARARPRRPARRDRRGCRSAGSTRRWRRRRPRCAGAGAAAGAAVEKVLVKRGRAGRRRGRPRAGRHVDDPAELRAHRRRWPRSSAAAVGVLLGGPLLGPGARWSSCRSAPSCC